MRLSELQSRIRDIILDQPMALGDAEEKFEGVFADNVIPLSERLGVYRNNVMGNVGNSMAEKFPLLEKLVGREFLDMMIRSFILVSPPQSGCLAFYGADFDEFIWKYPSAADFPYLADVARLEILAHLSTNAEDDQPWLPTDLIGIPAETISTFNVKLRDSVHLMKSRWPLEEIKNLCVEQNPDKTIDIHSGGVNLLILRPEFVSQAVKLSDGEFEFLNNLREMTLGDAVLKTMLKYPGFDFPKTLQSFMTLQIFLKPEMN